MNTSREWTIEFVRLSEQIASFLRSAGVHKTLVMEDVARWSEAVARFAATRPASVDLELAEAIWRPIGAIVHEARHAKSPQPLLDVASRMASDLQNRFEAFPIQAESTRHRDRRIVRPSRDIYSVGVYYLPADPPEYLVFNDSSGSGQPVGVGCLGLRWRSDFQMRSHRFVSVEQYLGWVKALVYDRPDVAEKALADEPLGLGGVDTALGDVDPEPWILDRAGFAMEACMAKFEQSPELAAVLESTGDRVLVYADPDDRVWGAGLSTDDPDTSRPHRWGGENLLGLLLMDVRDMLLPDPDDGPPRYRNWIRGDDPQEWLGWRGAMG